MATRKLEALVGKKGKVDVELLQPPAVQQPWTGAQGNIITLGGAEVVDPRDPKGERKIPDPFNIKVDAAGLATAQKALVEAAQKVLGKMSDGGRPAYAFGGEGAQHGGKPLPQLLIDAGNAGFDVMQPSANHIDLARCAVDAAYCAWVKAVHTAAGIPLLSVSVHMDAYLLMAAIHDPRAREILGEDPKLTDEQLRTVLLHKMALILIGAARLGIRALHLFWGQPGSVPLYGWPFHPAGGTNVKAMRALFVQIMKPLVRLAEQLGIFLCDEIHFGTIATNADDYIAVWEELGKPACLVLGFDPSHFWHGETWWQALDKLRKAGIKVILCHFKQTVLLAGRPMLSYQVDDRLRGMFFAQLASTSGIVDMNAYAGQLTIPGTGLVEFWHGVCNLPIPGYAEAEDPHWATWPVLVSGVHYLQGLLGTMCLPTQHFTAEM